MPEIQPLPIFFVGKELTNARITEFQNTKHVLLSNDISKPDTKSVWYSKEHVQEWLTEMDMAGADGLRIYFGAYDSGHPTLAGQLCLLMVMTRLNEGNDAHTDFTLEDEPDFAERSIAERSFGKATKKDFNVGSPCPPICSGHVMSYPENNE